MIDLEAIQARLLSLGEQALDWAQSPAMYTQGGLIVAALAVAVLASVLTSKLIARTELSTSTRAAGWQKILVKLRAVIFPLMIVVTLGIAKSLSLGWIEQSWLIKVVQGIAVIFLLYAVVKQFVRQPFVRQFVKWLVLPIAVLHVLGWLDEITTYLESIRLTVGNISISLYGVARVVVFGSVLFWLGRKSNDSGKQFIRRQEQLEIGTREVFAKLFEISVYVLVVFLILQVMGINLTTLAVFGGALGVGLGFGLQAIASNFISGLIILLDRSMTVGDYIELEDGRGGTIREINMRSTILETFDGKDIVVPNETFISSNFVNWTHKNKLQRYSLEFQIAYGSDVERAIDLIRDVVRGHPQVIHGDDLPIEMLADAEIAGFGDSGVDILVEFWMDGVDDGVNRVGADLWMMIWKMFKQEGIEIPYPRREVSILNDPLRVGDFNAPPATR